MVWKRNSGLVRSRHAWCLAALVAFGGWGFTGGCNHSSPAVPGEDALETVALMSISALQGYRQLVAVTPTLNGAEDAAPEKRAAAVGPALRHSLGETLANQTMPLERECLDAESVETECQSSGDTSTFRIRFFACHQEPDGEDGPEFTVNGGVDLVVEDPLACAQGIAEGARQRSVAFHDYSVTATGEGVGVVFRSFLNARLVAETTEDPSAPRPISVDGRFELLSVDDGLEYSMLATGLQVAFAEDSAPSHEIAVLNGGLALRIGSIGTPLEQTLMNVDVTRTVDASDNVTMTIDGISWVACLRDVVIETTEALHFAAGAAFPESGVIRVTIGMPSPQESEIHFLPDGSVELDVDADGTVERVVPNAGDLWPADRCRR